MTIRPHKYWIPIGFGDHFQKRCGEVGQLAWPECDDVAKSEPKILVFGQTKSTVWLRISTYFLCWLWLFYVILMLLMLYLHFFLHLFSIVPATLPWSLRDLHRVTGRCTWSAANSFLHVRGCPSIDVCVSSGIWNRRCWRNFPMSTTEMIWSDDVFGHCESDCEQQILNRLRLFRYFDVFCMCAVCTDRCNFEPPLNLLREQ